jgi:hypothetical protein
VYVNINPFGLKGSMVFSTLCIHISICNIIFLMKVFPVPTPPIRNNCNGVCMSFNLFKAMSLKIAYCSLFNILISL